MRLLDSHSGALRALQSGNRGMVVESTSWLPIGADVAVLRGVRCSAAELAGKVRRPHPCCHANAAPACEALFRSTFASCIMRPVLYVQDCGGVPCAAPQQHILSWHSTSSHPCTPSPEPSTPAPAEHPSTRRPYRPEQPHSSSQPTCPNC